MPTVYKNSDASAPVLTGEAGSLITVLDACLVNGYGSTAAAGWTKPYSGTNTAVYLPSEGHYLDVDDAAAGAAGAQEATVRGYEAMTAVATGTGPFPTVAQLAAPGEFIRKSATADATARAWVLVADGTTFYLFILSGDTAGRYQSFAFGRFYSLKAGDTYHSLILGHGATGSSATGLDSSSFATSSINTTPGGYLVRGRAGTGTSQQCGMIGMGGTLIASPFNGPNPSDGKIYLARVFIGEGSAASGLRGFMRGLYQIVTAIGLNDGDTFAGSGDFAGRTFTVIKTLGSGAAHFAIETSAWDSSV